MKTKKMFYDLLSRTRFWNSGWNKVRLSLWNSIDPTYPRSCTLSQRLSEVWARLSTTYQSLVTTDQTITALIPDPLVRLYATRAQHYNDIPVELAVPANLNLYPVCGIVEACTAVGTEYVPTSLALSWVLYATPVWVRSERRVEVIGALRVRLVKTMKSKK